MTAEMTYEKGWGQCALCRCRRPESELDDRRCRDADWCAGHHGAEIRLMFVGSAPDGLLNADQGRGAAKRRRTTPRKAKRGASSISPARKRGGR